MSKGRCKTCPYRKNLIMRDSRYAYPVARIKVLETHLLDKAFVDRLIGEKVRGILDLLQDTPYSEAMENLTSLFAFEAALQGHLSSTLRFLCSLAPDRELMDLFRWRFDFHNLTVLLKAKYLSLTPPQEAFSSLGTLELEILRDLVEKGDRLFFPLHLKRAFDEAQTALERGVDLQGLQGILQAQRWSLFCETARKYKNSFLKEIFTAMIDLANIKTFWRLRSMGFKAESPGEAFIEGGKVGIDMFKGHLSESVEAFRGKLFYTPYSRLSEEGLWKEGLFHPLEVACDDFLLGHLILRARDAFFSIEPLVAYLFVKENEAKLLRTIFIAKRNGFQEAWIRERLRFVHR